MSTVLEHFLHSVRYNTAACPETCAVPSSAGQHELAALLADQLRQLGLERVRATENAYALATLPGNVAQRNSQPVPSIGMDALEYFVQHPEVPHGPVQVAFVPDEEIGHGAALLNIEDFDADLAYTIDGTGLGTIEYENFNAALATVHLTGVSVHPGYAKNLMVNALPVAQDMLNGLTTADTSAHTYERQGFFHALDISGNEATRNHHQPNRQI